MKQTTTTDTIKEIPNYTSRFRDEGVLVPTNGDDMHNLRVIVDKINEIINSLKEKQTKV